MTLTANKVTEINKAYKAELENLDAQDTLNLNVGFDGYFSDTVYAGNSMVCRIRDITNMIKELETLRAVIEFETGVAMGR